MAIRSEFEAFRLVLWTDSFGVAERLEKWMKTAVKGAGTASREPAAMPTMGSNDFPLENSVDVRVGRGPLSIKALVVPEKLRRLPCRWLQRWSFHFPGGFPRPAPAGGSLAS